MTRGVVRAPSHLPGLSPPYPSVSVWSPLLIVNASLTHILLKQAHHARAVVLKRSARVSVVVDSRATTLQASTCGGLGRDLCDYFGADDLFSWVWRVFDLSGTCHSVKSRHISMSATPAIVSTFNCCCSCARAVICLAPIARAGHIPGQCRQKERRRGQEAVGCRVVAC